MNNYVIMMKDGSYLRERETHSVFVFTTKEKAYELLSITTEANSVVTIPDILSHGAVELDPYIGDYGRVLYSLPKHIWDILQLINDMTGKELWEMVSERIPVGDDGKPTFSHIEDEPVRAGSDANEK